MNKTFALSLFAACASFVMIGCGAPGDEALDESERLGTVQQGVDDPHEGGNHYSPEDFWAADSQGAYRIMGAGALNQGNGYLPVLVISPAYRHDVLQNAIECGLSRDQQVIDPVTNRTIPGHFGLAPNWEGAALTTSERRYVTACMAQRLNAYEVAIKILLKGRNKAINTVPHLDAKYPFHDSTVWGDLFSSVTPLGPPENPSDLPSPPFELFACSDSGLEWACSNGGIIPPNDWLHLRICDTLNLCGLTVLGSCSNPGICTVNASGYPTCAAPGGSFIETVHVQLTGETCAPPP